MWPPGSHPFSWLWCYIRCHFLCTLSLVYFYVCHIPYLCSQYQPYILGHMHWDRRLKVFSPRKTPRGLTNMLALFFSLLFFCVKELCRRHSIQPFRPLHQSFTCVAIGRVCKMNVWRWKDPSFIQWNDLCCVCDMRRNYRFLSSIYWTCLLTAWPKSNCEGSCTLRNGNVLWGFFVWCFIKTN